MQGYQAMQATAQTAWQSGSDSLSNTSTAETTWKFVWQTLTNTNSSNSKSSNLRQSSGDLSGNGISYEYTADSPRHCWQPLSGLRRLRTRPWPLEGNRWHSSARLCISKHSTRLSALGCVCVCFFQHSFSKKSLVRAST